MPALSARQHQVQASRSSATGLKGAQTYSTNSKKV
jgi:hypothetical protein